MRTLFLILAALSTLGAPPCQGQNPVREQKPECVILLHGLIRTSSAMTPIADALREEGFIVVNQDYPSRKYSIGELSDLAVNTGLDRCRQEGAQRVHFVTHSLGGILVRYYLSEKPIPELGRIVMLAPPNKGSTLIDLFEAFPELGDIIGPAGYQLGTNEESVPLMLGPANHEVGIITGDHTVNPVMSTYLKAPNDGKVTVESARLEGMTDFLIVPHSHPFIMRNNNVIGQTIYFLYFGKFKKPDPE
ncbi:MAG: alpha/beta fold hydrolase [Pseudomonadota bacterium]